MRFLWAFIIGGALCAIGQIFIDKTKLTPARILVSYVVFGVFLSFLGVYDNLLDFAGSGASVPLTGFGNILFQGVKKAVGTEGALGVLTGGLKAGSAGIAASVLFSFIAALLFRPKEKR